MEGSRRGRMLAESAAVEEWAVWLEVNGEPAVTGRISAELAFKAVRAGIAYEA